MDPTEDLPANVYAWDSALTGWDLLTEQQREGVYDYYCQNVALDEPPSMEEFAEDWARSAVTIRLQPYYQAYFARMDRPIDEEFRDMGVSDLCIAMDAYWYFASLRTAQEWMAAD